MFSTIKGLLSLIKKYAPDAVQQRHITHYKGHFIVNDAIQQVYRFCIAIRSKGTDMVNEDGNLSCSASAPSIVVNIVDVESGEVIRQVPDEKIQALSKRIHDFQKLSFSTYDFEASRAPLLLVFFHEHSTLRRRAKRGWPTRGGAERSPEGNWQMKVC